jgi:SAM-dependent methyltransferase
MTYNVYADTERAQAYATLEFPGTYFLAFRDLPAIIAAHLPAGGRALDFGCGAGRSTRFLQNLGFETTGIDVSNEMIELARKAEPAGTYLRIENGDFSALEEQSFDLVLAAFPFDNIPGVENRTRILSGLARLLEQDGRLILLGSTPEIYVNEWVSFTTADFPENRNANSGDEVRIIMTDVADRRPVVDAIWFDEDYRALFAASGLTIVAEHRPLGRPDDPHAWTTENEIAPWVIYVAERAA